MAKPYTEEEVLGFFLEFHQPNIPDLLSFMIRSSEYKLMNGIEKQEHKDYLAKINELHHSKILGPLSTPEDIQLQIERGKETLEKIDKGEDGISSREKIEKQIRMLEGKDKLIDFDRFVATEFTDKFLEKLIRDEWARVEFHYDFIEHWRYIFSSVTFNVDDIPEGKITLYRAGTKKGFAWTSNLNIAKWFYNRNANFYNKEAKYNRFLKLEVTKDDVLFYQPERSEEEYVLIPNENKIQVIPYSEHKDFEEEVPRKEDEANY